MKKKRCTLVVNTANGHLFHPVECSSISEARRRGREWFGYAYRIFVKDDDGKVVKIYRGFCDD